MAVGGTLPCILLLVMSRRKPIFMNFFTLFGRDVNLHHQYIPGHQSSKFNFQMYDSLECSEITHN